ncbi:MAG: hypothetical protein KHY93_08740 [Clostridiales bacterium]|nr:hypothetical protein [Clostridiales bacterium]
MKKLSKKAFTLGLLVLLAVIACIAGIFFYRQKNTDTDRNPYGFTQITLDEFDDCIHGKGQKNTFFIYVGRDDCPDCEAFSPKLQTIIKKEKISVLYYSTSQDREERPDEMYALLDEAKVTEVPVILEVINGKIYASYTGEEFLTLYEK